MKVSVPEISWHNCEPLYSLHIYPKINHDGSYNLATAAADRLVRLWKICFESGQSNPVKVLFLSEFTVHQSSVNAVRFSPDGKYMLSGSDDRSVVLWEVGSFESKNTNGDVEDYDIRDIWPVKKILRGHLEGVYDLSWAPCSTRAASASVDNSVIVWDVTSGTKLAVLREAKSYVQGVAWDPRNEYIVTLSSDRQARFYSIAKAFHCVTRLHQAAPVSGGPVSQIPAPPLFADDMVTRSFFRRAGFSPDGGFVILSGGVVEVPVPDKLLKQEKAVETIKLDEENDKEQSESEVTKCRSVSPKDSTKETSNVASIPTIQRHAAHLVPIRRTGKPGKPIISWQSPKRAFSAAVFCPLTFEPTQNAAKKRDADGVPLPAGSTKSRRRFVAALVAADAIILVETSKTCRPIGYVGGLHLDQLTDACWAPDGRLLMSCSTDGYCNLVVFGQNELGTPMDVPPPDVFDDKLFEKRKKGKGEKKKVAPVTVPVTTVAIPQEAISKPEELLNGGSSNQGKIEAESRMECSPKPEQSVSVLVPRRRVNLTTVSVQPGNCEPIPSSEGPQK